MKRKSNDVPQYLQSIIATHWSKTEITYTIVYKCVLYYFLILIFINIYWLPIQDNCCTVRVHSLKYNQQDATFSWSIYFYKLLYMFQAVPPPIIRSTKLHTASGIVKPILLPAAIVDEMELYGIPSIPDAVFTVLCFWWWAEEPPETCRAFYRNK